LENIEVNSYFKTGLEEYMNGIPLSSMTQEEISAEELREPTPLLTFIKKLEIDTDTKTYTVCLYYTY